MAPALIAIPNPSDLSVDLTVTGAVGAITVTRYVAGASPTGTPVRASFANSRPIKDYDAPFNTDLVYIARDQAGQSPQQSVRLDSTITTIAVMATPASYARVLVLADDNQGYAGASAAHKILGTNALIVTVEPLPFRTGTYRLLLPTVTDWVQLRAILMTGAVMLLRSPCPSEFSDTPFMLTSGRNTLRWLSRPPRPRVLEIDYQAVAPDSTPPNEYAWTYADVPAEFPTYADIPLEVSTYQDLAAWIPSAAAGQGGPGL